MSWLGFCFLLAQAAQPAYRVGSGRIVGGWAYVWAAYGIAWGALALYALSLWLRRAPSGPSQEPR